MWVMVALLLALVLVLQLAMPAWAGPDPAAVATATASWRVTDTAHLHIHAPTSTPSPELDAYARQEEAALVSLMDFFGGPLTGKVDLYLWSDEAEAQRVLGQALAFAVPSSLTVHTSAKHTPGHELTHIVVGDRFPGRWSRFIGEGTAVAFDQTHRAVDTEAAAAVRTEKLSTPIREVWTSSAGNDAYFYPVAGAFVSMLVDKGGKERFLKLLEEPSYEGARRVYGADLDGWIDAFQVKIGLTPDPALEALRARAKARMELDRQRFGAADLTEIDALYKKGSMKTAEGLKAYADLVERYPTSNRAGCSMMYLAQVAKGADREAKLRRVIADFDDAWYGDGTRAGAYARTLLALQLAADGRVDEAKALAAEVAASDPDGVDHGGASLVSQLRSKGLLP
jgi:hypothetical protein